MPASHAASRLRTLLTASIVSLVACPWSLALPLGGGGDPKPFPDEWFFDGASRPAPLKALEGKPAPALTLDKWIGTETSIAANKGKVIVVDFWATWCGPCMASIPHNVELVKKYGDQGLVFIGVHDSNSGWDKADSVVKDKSINYPVAMDKGGASTKDFALQFWPTYVAIDKSGVIRAAGLTPDKVEDVVKALLAEGGPDPSAAGSGGAAEFPPEFYLAALNRPKALKELEGKPAGKIKASSWIGKDPGEAAMKNSIVVLTFVNPSLSISMAALDKLAPLEKELASQGVVFLTVADGRSDDGWKKLTEQAKAKPFAFPIARDEVETKPLADAKPGAKPSPSSVTAGAFGVEFPPATIIIDRSGKVRAAGIKADKIKTVVEKLLAERVADPAPGDKKDEKPK